MSGGAASGASGGTTAGLAFRLTFPASPLSVRRALASVVIGLEPAGLDGDELGTIELVLAEALNNVVEHAYGLSRHGWIVLDLREGPGGLLVEIADQGRPMPEREISDSTPPPLPEISEATPEGGFGWFLIRDLSKDVAYRREDDTNYLSFRINLAQRPAKGAEDQPPVQPE